MKYLSKLLVSAFIGLASTGCTEKIDNDLTPLVELIETEGWYEDAFVRVLSIDASQDPIVKEFTHPRIVVKKANSQWIYTLELDGTAPIRTDSYDPTCQWWDPDYPGRNYQSCDLLALRQAHINSIYSLAIFEKQNLTIGSIPYYRVGEMRGGEELNAIAEYIIYRAQDYSCNGSYKLISQNSNTFVRAMLEYSGFYELYEEINGEAFRLGSSAIGQNNWENCNFDEPAV